MRGVKWKQKEKEKTMRNKSKVNKISYAGCKQQLKQQQQDLKHYCNGLSTEKQQLQQQQQHIIAY